MKSAWRMGKRCAQGAAIVLMLGSGIAIAQAIPGESEAEYLMMLEELATDMNLASLTEEMQNRVTASAPKLPQIGAQDEDILLQCEALLGQAKNGQAKFETVGVALMVSDDYLAELTDCYAELSGELANTLGEHAVLGS